MSRAAFALTRLLSVTLTACLIVATLAPHVAAQDTEPTGLWEDFSHYVLIARPDLAADAGRQLLDTAEGDALLEAVEGSRYEPERVLGRAKLVEDTALADTAAALERAIQQARIDRSRDPERIARDIELLAEGDRAYTNAVERLRAAGQYAAPQLLATLQDPQKKTLHPFVLSAMAEVGRDLAYPLAVALPDLQPVPMTMVAQVLARIGYPTPLPYMKQTIEAPDTDPDAQRIVQTAYDSLLAASDLPQGLSAAQLYTVLSRSLYSAGAEGMEVVGYDAATDQGIVWAYLSQPEPALVPIFVPGQIYPDARALRAAKSALALDPSIDEALSYYIASNLRRENRLPDGANDPSYQEPQPASFYAMLAGPQRLHDVLTLALNAGDAPLALDAINALGSTAGTEALTTTRPSLIRGLSYPDRRVRFRSAEALAQARPSQPYEGSFNVVKILADQVRQSETKYAMVLADDQETVNALIASMSELGYEAFGGTRAGDLTSQLNQLPGVDLVVVHKDREAVEQFVAESAGDFKLNATPVLALVSAGDQVRLKNQYADQPRVLPVVRTTEAGELEQAAQAAAQRLSGEPIAAEESLAFSLRALELLGELALTDDAVYDVMDAQAAIEQALTDDRTEVVKRAGQVLALLGNDSAQQALLDAALQEGAAQVSLLESVAASAQHHGNMATDRQTDQLLDLVKSAQGDVAIAAAKAHGSLMLSTPNAVQLITAD